MQIFVQILILILINILIYYPTIFYDRVMDDINWHKRGIPKIQFNSQIFYTISMRLYGCGTFGNNLIVDHITTLSLHIISCILIYFAFGHNITSFITALLFSVNPVNHQTAIWLNGRRYQIVTILAMLMFILPTYLSPVLYLTTCLFQYTAFFIPILLPMPYALLPFIFILIARHTIVDKYNIRKKLIPTYMTYNPLYRIIPITKYFSYNLIRATGLLPCFAAYPFLEHPDTHQKRDAVLTASVLVIICTASVAIFIPSSRLYLLFITLSLTQWLLFPCTQQCADRYLSLPSIFISLIIAQNAPFLALLLVPLYISRIKRLMPMYANILAFYAYHKKVFPTMKRLLILEKLYNL